MKIGVLSDTHLKEPDSDFKRIVELHFREVEKIIHLGDFVSRSVAEYLSGLNELIAVCGNMDPVEIQKLYPKKKVITLGKFRFGLIHGWGSPFGIEARVKDEFGEIDAIIYGHTHTPANHLDKGIYFFNPGSLTRSFIQKCTIGILNIGEKIEGQIVEL